MPQTKEKKKELRRQAAIAAGREYVEHKPTGIEAKDPTEWRREYKRMKRREAGCRLRAEITAVVQENQKARDANKTIRPRLNDAHVRRYKELKYARKKASEYYKKHTAIERQKKSQYKENLPDAYVVYYLKAQGMPDAAITAKVIELKREAMWCRRLQRMLKTAIKDDWKETHETITKHP